MGGCKILHVSSDVLSAYFHVFKNGSHLGEEGAKVVRYLDVASDETEEASVFDGFHHVAIVYLGFLLFVVVFFLFFVL